MKTCACALALIFGCLTLAAQDTPSALERDQQGWVDVTPDQNLSGWSILTIPPGGQPASSQDTSASRPRATVSSSATSGSKNCAREQVLQIHRVQQVISVQFL